MIRKSAVAGQFYPSGKSDLEKELNNFFDNAKQSSRKKAFGIISPHAGYMYSGQVAANVYHAAELPEIAVILAPNHYGFGKNASIISEGRFEIPLGTVEIASQEAMKLLAGSAVLHEDSLSQVREHSLEVQLPFLKKLKPDLKIIPITLMHLTYYFCEKLSEELAALVSENREKYVIVASSDMNHFESQNVGNRKDRIAIERVLALDPKGLYNAVSEHDISMCGFIPAVIMLLAAKKLQVKNAELVDYRTSGDITGDFSSVVGYAGMIVY
jgi:AmmeMemoRadiSam system protein B